MKAQSQGSPDPVATCTLALVAVAALAASWAYPWWVMHARAPQYGQRVLVVEVGPRGAAGDVFEMDGLGHYVGIAPMDTMARVERKLAPVGLGVGLLLLAALPFLRRRSLRIAAAVPVLLMPAFFLWDLSYWTQKSVDERDPEAALNLTVTKIETRLFGTYEIGQFKVEARAGDGLRLASIAAVLAAGLAFSRPLRPPGLRRRSIRGLAPAATTAAALAATLSLGEARAAQRTLTPADSVQAAIDAAADGDELALSPGVYRQRFTVHRRVALRGDGAAVIDGGGRGTVVTVTAPGAALVGLSIRGSGRNFNTEDAGLRVQAADVRMSELTIEDTLFGIFALQADRCVIERSAVVGRDVPVSQRGDGIRLWYSHGCRLTGNQVRRSRDVVIWYSSDTVVEDNSVRQGRYGLHYMYSDRNSFRHNRFEDNEVGAAIMYSRGITLEENAFSFSNGPSAYGLLLKDADDVFIRRNRFVANSGALFFDGAPQSRGAKVEVQGNLVARNDVGVVLQPSSRGIQLWENAFLGNRTQVQVQGSGSDPAANAWAVGGRGNYWSDALVYDRDGDGVSEVPYRAESTYEVLAERRPELAFFAGSPATDAIDAAARLFPIFAPTPRMEDPRPLAAAGLSGWTGPEVDSAGSPELTLAGAGLVLLAAVGALGARRMVQ